MGGQQLGKVLIPGCTIIGIVVGMVWVGIPCLVRTDEAVEDLKALGIVIREARNAKGVLAARTPSGVDAIG